MRDSHFVDKLVSVVIPTYNCASLLPETLRTVVAQTYPDIEIIVVDNGSTDETAAVVAGLGIRNLRYHKIPVNTGGPAGPRNEGIRMARGEYIAFLDSDDLWLPEKIARQVALLESDCEAGLCYCKCRFFGEGYSGGRIFPKRGFSGNVFEILTLGNFVPTVSVVCRRTALDSTGLFDESPALRAFEDYEMWMRIAGKYRFCYIDEPLCLFRVHAKNFLGTDNLRSHLGAFRALCSVIDKIGLDDAHLKNAVARHYLTTAMAWLETGDCTNFDLFLKRSLKFERSLTAVILGTLEAVLGAGVLGRIYSVMRSILPR